MIGRWPLLRQIAGRDRLGLGAAAVSEHTEHLRPRTETADTVAASVCPYCAVGCGQLVYAQGGRVTQIEGDPNSPISRGSAGGEGPRGRGRPRPSDLGRPVVAKGLRKQGAGKPGGPADQGEVPPP